MGDRPSFKYPHRSAWGSVFFSISHSGRLFNQLHGFSAAFGYTTKATT